MTTAVTRALSFEAAEDFTNKKYRVARLDTDGKIGLPDATTNNPLGIIQNEPITGQAGSVAPIGSGMTSKVVLGATLDEGDRVALEFISSSDTGKVIAAASGLFNIGTLAKGGAEDDLGEVILSSQTVDA